MSVTVLGRNDAPVAGADTVNISGGVGALIAASTLLANDSDPDNGDGLSTVGVASAVHGNVALNAQGNVIFTADTGFSGLASFDYTASDGHGGTASATVKVNVTREAHGGAALVAGTTRLVSISYPNVDMQSFPATEVLTDGTYVVAWSRRSDGSGSGIVGQRFAADGTPIGGHFGIAATTTSNQLRPNIAALPGGGFLASWESDHDGVSWNIYQQRFDAAFNKVGGQVLVNSTTPGNQNYSTATVLADGGVVNWSSNGQDGGSWGVYQQRYAASGARVGGEERVNATTLNNQTWSSIATLQDGGWVVSWQSKRPTFGWCDLVNGGGQRFPIRSPLISRRALEFVLI